MEITEESLFAELGRLYFRNKLLMGQQATVVQENRRLAAENERLASMIPTDNDGASDGA